MMRANPSAQSPLPSTGESLELQKQKIEEQAYTPNVGTIRIEGNANIAFRPNQEIGNHGCGEVSIEWVLPQGKNHRLVYRSSSQTIYKVNDIFEHPNELLTTQSATLDVPKSLYSRFDADQSMGLGTEEEAHTVVKSSQILELEESLYKVLRGQNFIEFMHALSFSGELIDGETKDSNALQRGIRGSISLQLRELRNKVSLGEQLGINFVRSLLASNSASRIAIGLHLIQDGIIGNVQQELIDVYGSLGLPRDIREAAFGRLLPHLRRKASRTVIHNRELITSSGHSL